MPGPSFFTPRRVSPSLPKKRFTVSQAQKTLPLVSRIVADIVQTHDQAVQMQTNLERSQESREQTHAQRKLDGTLDRLQDLVNELSDVGCELKDYQTGLIDFVGRHQGREVYLCWKLGEEKISYWHELNAGFSGRKPIGMLEETE
jgi:hypothetical protein